MLIYTFALFVALRALGIVFFLDTGHISALIPNFIADLFLACALLGIKKSWRKHAMHAAIALALLLAVSGIIMAVIGAGQKLFGDAEQAPMWLAILEQLLMGLLCAGYVVLGVRSFIAARRARQASAPAPGSSAAPRSPAPKGEHPHAPEDSPAVAPSPESPQTPPADGPDPRL